jgi:excisionase family DNA binding protein
MKQLNDKSFHCVDHQLVTVHDAAQYLSISVSTLYGWVYQRRITFVKVGRALRFDIADLDKFIQTGRTQARPRPGDIETNRPRIA